MDLDEIWTRSERDLDEIQRGPKVRKYGVLESEHMANPSRNKLRKHCPAIGVVALDVPSSSILRAKAPRTSDTKSPFVSTPQTCAK